MYLKNKDKLFATVLSALYLLAAFVGWSVWGEAAIVVSIGIATALLLAVQMETYRRIQRQLQQTQSELEKTQHQIDFILYKTTENPQNASGLQGEDLTLSKLTGHDIREIFGNAKKIRPPRTVPTPELLAEYTMNGQVEICYRYIDDTSDKPLLFTREQIDNAIKKIERRETGIYGGIDSWLYRALEKYTIKNKKVAIIGSADQGYGPWYECVCLCFGGEPITIEYNEVIYEDERLKAVTPEKAGKTNIPFDAAISVSSYEHDGLGRYGDPIDPVADIKSMRQLKKMVKQKGLLYLAVPLGKDKLCFNTKRIYGKIRLPRLIEGWTMIDSVGFDENLLDRDTKLGWKPEDEHGRLLHPDYPEYCPILILRND